MNFENPPPRPGSMQTPKHLSATLGEYKPDMAKMHNWDPEDRALFEKVVTEVAARSSNQKLADKTAIGMHAAKIAYGVVMGKLEIEGKFVRGV